jgi:uncharacterized protein with NAD-binding domain and iron-sulfur cluster
MPRIVRNWRVLLPASNYAMVSQLRWQVVDAGVVRVKRGVTSFSPGSAAWMPPTATPLPGVFMAGDWIKQVGREQCLE